MRSTFWMLVYLLLVVFWSVDYLVTNDTSSLIVAMLWWIVFHEKKGALS